MNKSDRIRDLHDRGYTVQEISDKLGVRYQFAYNVIKHYMHIKEQIRAQQEAAAAAKAKRHRWWPFGR